MRKNEYESYQKKLKMERNQKLEKKCNEISYESYKDFTKILQPKQGGTQMAKNAQNRGQISSSKPR